MKNRRKLGEEVNNHLLRKKISLISENILIKRDLEKIQNYPMGEIEIEGNNYKIFLSLANQFPEMESHKFKYETPYVLILKGKLEYDQQIQEKIMGEVIKLLSQKNQMNKILVDGILIEIKKDRYVLVKNLNYTLKRAE